MQYKKVLLPKSLQNAAQNRGYTLKNYHNKKSVAKGGKITETNYALCVGSGNPRLAFGDVSLGEDANRTRKGHGAENLSTLRRLALGLMNKVKGKLPSSP